jgi:hypothetical protein
MNRIGMEVMDPAILMFANRTAKYEWTGGQRTEWLRVGIKGNVSCTIADT